MRLAVAAAQAAGVRSAEGWQLEGNPKRQSHLTRKIAGVSEAIPVHLNSKPLMVKIRGFFVLSTYT